MKTALPILVALAAVAGFVAADNVPTAVNATVGSSAQKESSNDVEAFQCWTKPDGLGAWYYDSKSNGPYRCTLKNSQDDWSMLNAYRSGGIEGVHWKYTENPNDGECLNNWKIYSSDGQTVTATVSGRTTTQGGWRWCALPVYRPGGVVGKQWDYCTCKWQTNPPHP
jgi:hypothetical protein